MRSDDLVGFIGRRNPTKGDHDFAGPKYLNTASTAVFTKGDQMFGLTEGRTALDAGGVPVLVEGPLDALAVTIATRGCVRRCRTAWNSVHRVAGSEVEAVLRRRPKSNHHCHRPGRGGLAVGAAGVLAACGAPSQPAATSRFPRGMDPADVLRTEGAAALAGRLAGSSEFAGVLIAAFSTKGSRSTPTPSHALNSAAKPPASSAPFLPANGRDTPTASPNASIYRSRRSTRKSSRSGPRGPTPQEPRRRGSSPRSDRWHR